MGWLRCYGAALAHGAHYHENWSFCTASCHQDQSVAPDFQARRKAMVLPLDRRSTRRRAMPSSTTNSTLSGVDMR